ncbi:hypothetical protein ATJ88_0081 [Isoptericola jiangsuensis]|uniref:Heme peroxidase n=1 Tax=Isoptericola jiangsuensis TaxID=548579 RepID=A0A2A9ET52_9MICO|nr:hypothetical protein [Isoptericola jiangsuensis]PFG41442.1 hypothetical protein ATJ88_0081 [Isoptericola jiangsuensis]
MSDDGAAVQVLAGRVLGIPETWKVPTGYPDSLALAAIDSVFSLQSRYSAVESILRRYRQARRGEGAEPEHDSGPELLAFIERGGGPEQVVDTFNRSIAPGTGRGRQGQVLKVSALVAGVSALEEVGITSAADLRGASDSTLAAAQRAWRGVRGLGLASWDYLLMHVGTEGVKADTMIRRFVTRAVGESVRVSDIRARAAVKDAAASMGVSERVLDHRIWRYESGRD